jgi:hypothetical protein
LSESVENNDRIGADRRFHCELSSTLLESLLRSGAVKAEDLQNLDARSRATVRESVLRSCIQAGWSDPR